MSDVTLVFPNVITDIGLSASQIESQIRDYHLEFSTIKDAEIEWRTSVPFFLPSFHSFLRRQKMIPTQAQFWSEYFDSNRAYLAGGAFTTVQLGAIRARAYRSYPSLVRDLHFGVVLSELSLFEEVISNPDLDITYGIDLLIVDRGLYFGVSLFTDTTRSKEGRMKKTNRHGVFDDVIYIELPVSFSGSKKCGEFFLYSMRETSRLIETIRKNHGQN